MKLCLAIAFQNEANWLRLHLPVLMRSDLDGLVALDGGSTDDGPSVIKQHTPILHRRRFDWNWGDHMNALIEAAEAEGYDAILRLDPDELMFPGHINQMRKWLQKYPALAFPRINFEIDRCHWCKSLWPDTQLRAWRLNGKWRYQGRVHELLALPKETEVQTVNEWPIYHYEGIKPGPERQLKGVNYWRIQHNLEPLSELLPQTPAFKPRPHEPFLLQQPIHPIKCGVKAPLQKELAYAD